MTFSRSVRFNTSAWTVTDRRSFRHNSAPTDAFTANDGLTRPRSRFAFATTSAPYCAVRNAIVWPESSIGSPLL